MFSHRLSAIPVKTGEKPSGNDNRQRQRTEVSGCGRGPAPCHIVHDGFQKIVHGLSPTVAVNCTSILPVFRDVAHSTRMLPRMCRSWVKTPILRVRVGSNRPADTHLRSPDPNAPDLTGWDAIQVNWKSRRGLGLRGTPPRGIVHEWPSLQTTPWRIVVSRGPQSMSLSEKTSLWGRTGVSQPGNQVPTQSTATAVTGPSGHLFIEFDVVGNADRLGVACAIAVQRLSGEWGECRGCSHSEQHRLGE